MKVAIITLGCDKNTVDSERCLAALADHGAVPTTRMDEAELIVVNTCGFIDAAKRESIDALLEAGRYKVDGACQALVAIGCMVERHGTELAAELPEVDLLLGASEMHRLGPALVERGVLQGAAEVHPGMRLFSGELPHVRYLKISEGCDHGCAFCAIPLMRGRHRSFDPDDVVREAQLLELQGARELNLVAQDLAHYGRDLPAGVRLPDLLERLVAETSVSWFRLLYLYSTGITPHLLDVLSREPRIVRYLDMPIQHASDAVLERMRRPERRGTIRARVQRFRDALPEVAIRTTCIVGFPGESDEDFETLLEFLEEMRFDRVGAFTYSSQEGTRAFALPDDVPEGLKRERLERLTELQRVLTAERYEAHVGRTVQCIVDRASVIPGDPVQARATFQADDVDGVTWLQGAEKLVPGTIVDAHVEEAVDDYDLRATVERVSRPMGASIIPRIARSLPLARATTMGSFGR